MQAFRVWSTWVDDPESDAMASMAFELEQRAQDFAVEMNAQHARATGMPIERSTCRYVVREETIPRDIVFDGKPDRVVMVALGQDATSTDVSTKG